MKRQPPSFPGPQVSASQGGRPSAKGGVPRSARHPGILFAWILVTLLLGGTPAWANEAIQGRHVDLSGLDAAARVQIVRAVIDAPLEVELAAGERISGVIVAVDASHVTLRVRDQETRQLLLADLASLHLPGTPPQVTAPKPAEPTVPQGVWRATLKSGKYYFGRVQDWDADSIKLRIEKGVVLTLPRAKLASFEQVSTALGKIPGADAPETIERVPPGENGWPRDPNRTRYFFGPSAMTLSEGDRYFSQKELAFSEVGWGLTDHVTLMMGGVVFAWFIEPPDSFNLTLAVKAGWEVMDNVHVAVGAYGLAFPGLQGGVGGGFLFSSLTVGDQDAHATISVGVPFVVSNNSEIFSPVVSLAGNLRVSRLVALVTENWVIPTLLAEGIEGGVISAAGVRFIAGDFAVDVGFVNVFSGEGPAVAPWLDFTYNWGGSP